MRHSSYTMYRHEQEKRGNIEYNCIAQDNMKLLIGRTSRRALVEGGDVARLGVRRGCSSKDDARRAFVFDAGENARVLISQGMSRELGGMTVVVAPDAIRGISVRSKKSYNRFRGPSPLWFGNNFFAREEKEALERLHNLDLDFNLLELAVNKARLDAPLLLRERHHHGVRLYVVVRPRACLHLWSRR